VGALHPQKEGEPTLADFDIPPPDDHVIQRDTLPERRYIWTHAGRRNARRNGVTDEEVKQALYAPPGMRYERPVADLLLIAGMAESGRVIFVFCYRSDSRWRHMIAGAAPMTGPDLDEWRRRL
jgi:hypothetical protein